MDDRTDAERLEDYKRMNHTLGAALDLAEAQIAQALALAPRSWDVRDADSAESREARAYNSVLQQVQAIFRGDR